MMSLRNVGKILLVNLVLLLGGALILELVFGTWFTPNRMRRLNIRTDIEVTFDTGHLFPSATGKSLYRRDKYGFRGAYPSPSEIDILTIGGSTTDQRLLGEGETWQDVLAAEFAASGRRVSVVNAGVEGQSTFGHIRNFDWWFPFVPQLKPKYVLAYVGINDVFRIDDTVPLDHVAPEDGGGFGEYVKERSALYDLYLKLAGAWLAARVHRVGHDKLEWSAVEWTDAPLLSNHDSVMAVPLAMYEERLVHLIRKIRALGAEPILVTQTTRKWRWEGGKLLGVPAYSTISGQQINGVDYYYMLNALNRRTLEIGQREGGVCIDLADGIEFEEDDIYDFVHTTPKGARKVGRYLYSQLQARF